MNCAPLTVVIPTYNRRRIVRDAIDSVLLQTVSPAQIVVIDDGSRDGTAEGLRSYGGRISYVYQPNAGLSAARNHGIRLATEQFVGFLDDDDVWHPRMVELQMECFQNDTGLGLLGAQRFDWPCRAFAQVVDDPMTRFRAVTWEQLVVRTLIQVSSVIVRRDVLDRAGGFDVAMKSSEDREWFLRVADVARVGVLDIPLCGYRDTPGSMCKDPAAREPAMREILRRLDEKGAWRGRHLLRRKSYSYMHHTCSVVHAWAGDHAGAVRQLLTSLALYPLPYRREEVEMRFSRIKRLAVNLLRLARLKQPDGRSAARAWPEADALLEYRRSHGAPMSDVLAAV